MDLKTHYDSLWKQTLPKFKRAQFEFDPLINAAEDTRYGVTLLARPSDEVKQNILKPLDKIKSVAPNQYYYPDSDLHLTVLSIISCYAGFTLDEIDPLEYRDLISSAIDSVSPFRIQFKGLTASPSCILVQGFPENDQLNKLRNNLRNKFNQSKLQHSIDQRYKLQTAHMTVIRFKEPFKDSPKFVRTISDLRDHHFGSCLIKHLELVGNDWYQQEDKVKLISTFELR